MKALREVVVEEREMPAPVSQETAQSAFADICAKLLVMGDQFTLNGKPATLTLNGLPLGQAKITVKTLLSVKLVADGESMAIKTRDLVIALQKGRLSFRSNDGYRMAKSTVYRDVCRGERTAGKVVAV